jgi:hypothetical protein
MANAERELHELVPDPSLRVIMQIGSADTDPEDPKQYVSWMLQSGNGLINYYDLPNSCQYHRFHTSVSLLKESTWNRIRREGSL